jgi:hypothetical protein
MIGLFIGKVQEEQRGHETSKRVRCRPPNKIGAEKSRWVSEWDFIIFDPHSGVQ